MKVEKALILAGGKGTRFMPYTKAFPKEMLAVVDKPALQVIVDEVRGAGIKDIGIVISPEKQSVKKHFAKDLALAQDLREKGKTVEAAAIDEINNIGDITFFCQEKADGSGMAVALAEEWADGKPFALLNGDDVIFNKEKTVTAQLCEAFEKCGKTVIGVQTVDRESISKYATCSVVKSEGRLNYIDNIIEKPREDQIISLLAPLGRYVLTPDIFEIIKKTPVRGGNEINVTDSMQIQAQNGGICAYEFEGKRYDFGDKFGYIKGFTELALADDRFGAKYLAYLKDLLKNL